MTDSSLIVAELQQGALRSSTQHALAAASKLFGGTFDILCIGERAKAASEQARKYGAGKVLCAEVAGGYIAERYAPCVAEVAKGGGYRVVMATATTYGKDLLPRVAAKLRAGYAADISAIISTDGGEVSYRRPMYAGNMTATLQVTTPIQVVTVRPSEFAAAAPGEAAGNVEDVAANPDPAAARIKFEGLDEAVNERPELTEAHIVVSGGVSLKSAENFKNVLEPLVDALGAAMGASRAACDAGFVSHDLQVGQTGKVVAPKLYIAVGISGAIQHVAGMKGAKTIVAINTNKEAPIAEVADYFWSADLFEAVPALTAAIKKQ